MDRVEHTADRFGNEKSALKFNNPQDIGTPMLRSINPLLLNKISLQI